MKVDRRNMLLAILAGLTWSKVTVAKPAVVPPIWNGKLMYESMLKDGTGFINPGKPGRAKAYVFFDTQCSDCIRLLDRLYPLLGQVEVMFFPCLLYTSPSPRDA